MSRFSSLYSLLEGGASFVRTMQSIAPTRRAATSAWSCSHGLASWCTPLAGQPVEWYVARPLLHSSSPRGPLLGACGSKTIDTQWISHVPSVPEGMKTAPSTCTHTGTSVLYTILIFASRRAILGNEPTSLSSALGFLVRCAPRVIHRTKPHNPLPQACPSHASAPRCTMDEQ